MTEQPNPYLLSPPSDLRRLTKGPAIALISIAVLNILTILASMVISLLGIGAFIDPSMLNAFDLPPEVTEVLNEVFFAEQNQMGQIINMANYFFILILSAFMLYGGIRMLHQKQYGFALTAAILAVLPCTYCCCPSILVGIWALIILLKPEVKYAFHHQAGA